MEINKYQWDLCSDYLIQNLDFDIIYNNCADVSKKKFYKEDIISSIKKMIKEYPNFDRSVKGRIESKVSTLGVSVGYLNGYMYLFNSKHTYYGYTWLLTNHNLFKIVEEHKSDNSHYFIFNTKDYLRNLKLKKICQDITKHTKLIQE